MLLVDCTTLYWSCHGSVRGSPARCKPAHLGKRRLCNYNTQAAAHLPVTSQINHKSNVCKDKSLLRVRYLNKTCSFRHKRSFQQSNTCRLLRCQINVLASVFSNVEEATVVAAMVWVVNPCTCCGRRIRVPLAMHGPEEAEEAEGAEVCACSSRTCKK